MSINTEMAYQALCIDGPNIGKVVTVPSRSGFFHFAPSNSYKEMMQEYYYSDTQVSPVKLTVYKYQIIQYWYATNEYLFARSEQEGMDGLDSEDLIIALQAVELQPTGVHF